MKMQLMCQSPYSLLWPMYRFGHSENHLFVIIGKLNWVKVSQKHDDDTNIMSNPRYRKDWHQREHQSYQQLEQQREPCAPLISAIFNLF